MRWLWIAPFACAAVLAQMHSAITRESGELVQTTEGSLPLALASHFRFTTAGTVIVRGGEGPLVSYKIRQRVKAASDTAGRGQLGNVLIRTSTRANWSAMTVLAGDPARIATEMYLTVPRNLQELVLSSVAGNVEAYDMDGAVSAETGGGRIQMDRIGGGVIAKTGGSDIRIGRVNAGLRCFSGGGSIEVDYAGGETWCETAGGEIVIGESAGMVHATTAGGNIRVRRAAASVVAKSDGGLIEIGQSGGLVTAQTRGGSIEVGGSKGVECESAAGAIRLRGLVGPLRAETAMGSILAELLPQARLAESTLNSGVGDITVLIPSNLAVSVRALSESRNRPARIVSDFPEIRVTAAPTARGGAMTAEGALNGGGPLLRITASSGMVYLRRQR